MSAAPDSTEKSTGSGRKTPPRATRRRHTSDARGVVLRPGGDLDDEACSTLRRAVGAALATGTRHVVLDFSDVGRLERPAADLLRGLERYLRSHQGGLAITFPSADARRALVINDLAHLLALQDLSHPTPASPKGPRPVAHGSSPVRSLVREISPS